jgi:hypothetical protein
MNADQHRLSWLCDNIEQNLSRIDRVLDEIVSEPLGESTVAAGEPWGGASVREAPRTAIDARRNRAANRHSALLIL